MNSFFAFLIMQGSPYKKDRLFDRFIDLYVTNKYEDEDTWTVRVSN